MCAKYCTYDITLDDKKCTFKNVCQDYADDFTLDIRVSVNTVSHDSHVFRSWRVMKC